MSLAKRGKWLYLWVNSFMRLIKRFLFCRVVVIFLASLALGTTRADNAKTFLDHMTGNAHSTHSPYTTAFPSYKASVRYIRQNIPTYTIEAGSKTPANRVSDGL